MELSSKPIQVLLCGLAILPACFLAVLIYKYGVDLPYWEQWELVTLFEKFSRGTLSFYDFFEQQLEFREFLPKLIFLALGWLTRWDIRYEMWVIFLLACFVSFSIYLLGKKTLGDLTIQRQIALLVSNIFIFSPIQYENWLFGIQIVYFIPIACIMACLLIGYSGLGTKVKFLSCAILSIISTFSSANGILCWVVVLPVLAWSSSYEDWQKKKWFALAWTVGLILSVVFYFYGYEKPAHHPSMTEAFTHPVRAMIYFFAFTGATLGWGKGIVAASAGVALTSLFVLPCLYFWKFRADFNLAWRMLGWLMLGAYAVLTAVLVTVGRLGFGIGQALTARYMAFSLFLIIALVHLMPIILQDSEKRGYFIRNRTLMTRVAALALIIVVLLHVRNFPLATRYMAAMRLDHLQGKACLLFINFIQGECLTDKLFPDLSLVQQGARTLDRLGFLRPSLVKSNKVQDIQGDVGSDSRNYGAFDSLTKSGDDTYVASGWAVLPGREEPADAVILAYEDANGDSIVFTLAGTGTERTDIAQAQRKDAYSHAGWQKSFSLQGLPAKPVKLSAWALDAITGKAFRLDGTQVIE